MSILSLFKRSSQFGAGTLAPGTDVGQSRIQSTQTNFTQGSDVQLGGRGNSNLVKLTSGYSNSTQTSYTTTAFQDRLARRNQLVDYKAKTYLRPGNFEGTIGTYADRIFAEQSLGPDQFAQTPANAISTLSMSIPVLTPTTNRGT